MMRLAVVSSTHPVEGIKRIRRRKMSFVVVAKFPCKPGQVEAMGGLFRVALSDTREFAGCERIDVVLNEASGTYLLVEYWDQESSYDTYLQWRTDTGIAEVLAPHIEGGWDGVLASVDRLGQMQDI
jgi:quinol monooxygenase YgiN